MKLGNINDQNYLYQLPRPQREHPVSTQAWKLVANGISRYPYLSTLRILAYTCSCMGNTTQRNAKSTQLSKPLPRPGIKLYTSRLISNMSRAKQFSTSTIEITPSVL